MDYPKPLVVPPLTAPHKQTFILLHGRGASGEKFGPTLLDWPVPEAAASTTTTLAKAFPHARFVFPTAARRRATVYRRAYTHQWFNNWKLDPPATDREELQMAGLCETTRYLHGLWQEEIAAVGAANVVVGGLSQGCAASLIAFLLWDGPPLAALVGMCGWLPFTARLREHLSLPSSMEEGEEDDGGQLWANDGHAFDPFQRDEEDSGDTVSPPDEDLDPPARAVRWLSEELSNSGSEVRIRGTGPRPAKVPVFLGHGTEDDRVSIILGREASSCLSGLGVDVCWREYGSLGHWYSGDLLRDMVQFVKTRTKWDEHI